MRLATDFSADFEKIWCRSYNAFISSASLLDFKGKRALSRFRTKRSQVGFSGTENDLLLAFGGNEFATYLAYLADMFEALNQLNKKQKLTLSCTPMPLIRLSQSSNFATNEQLIIISHHFTA